MADHADDGLTADVAKANLIVENDAIQAGAATFRGTRILVHHIADLLAQGASEAELRNDYPRLTRAMLKAAPVYVRAHPKNSGARMPPWQQATIDAGEGSQPDD